MTFKEATDALGVPLAEVAVAVGREYATVAAYRTGRIEPPAEVWRALAQFAREHGANVRSLAREIAIIAKEVEREERMR